MQSALAAGAPDAAGGAQGLGSGFVLGTADADVGGAPGAADVAGPAAGREPPRLPNREAKGLAAPPAAGTAMRAGSMPYCVAWARRKATAACDSCQE